MDSLSDDILAHVFAQGSPSDMERWQQCCRRWNTLMNDDFVWKRAFLNFWERPPFCRLSTDSWKAEYTLRTDAIRPWMSRLPNQMSAVKMSWGHGEFLDADLDLRKWLLRLVSTESLTSAHVKSGVGTGRTVLYFSNFFGEAPITATVLFKTSGAFAIGFADGRVVLYDKTPEKTLQCDNHKLDAMITQPVWRIEPMDTIASHILVIHKRAYSHAADLVIWNVARREKLHHCFLAELGGFAIVPGLRVAWGDAQGNLHVWTAGASTKTVSLATGSISTIKSLDGTAWIMAAVESTIHLYNYDTERTCSHSLGRLVKMLSVPNDSCSVMGTNGCSVVAVDCDDDVHHLRLSELETDGAALVIEQETLRLPRHNSEVLDVLLGPVVTIVLAIEGFWVLDSLTMSCINDRRIPKHYAKLLVYGSDPMRMRPAQIVTLRGDKLIVLWGRNMAQIWNFGPDTAFLARSTNDAADKKNRGSRVVRKNARYAVTAGVDDWEDEVDEERRETLMRDRVNFPGMTETELLAYAMMLSREQVRMERRRNRESTPTSAMASLGSSRTTSPGVGSDSDNPDLLLALQLSLHDR